MLNKLKCWLFGHTDATHQECFLYIYAGKDLLCRRCGAVKYYGDETVRGIFNEYIKKN